MLGFTPRIHAKSLAAVSGGFSLRPPRAAARKRPRISECNLADKTPQVRHVEVPDADAGMRLDNWLLRQLKGVPRSHVYRLIRSGQVRVNRSRARANTRLGAADRVRIPPVRQSRASGAGRPPDDLIARVEAAIIAEGDDWLALNKPPGLAVHGGSGIRFGAIEVLRASRPDEGLELAHRLDRGTSGCLLVARGRVPLNRLRRAMRDAAAEKRYLALLSGRWRGGPRQVDAALVRDRTRSGERMVEVDEAGKTALTDFGPRRVLSEVSLVEARISTGRMHQIRVHAAHLGHPVAGDEKYGDAALNRRLRASGLKRPFLHAHRLLLPHGEPDGSPLVVEAPLPQDLSRCLRELEAADDT